jgi:U3 small nucleolar RNA-associated protein 3
MNDGFDAYGEATALHSVDAADKTARKKSLRFHTSKIESSSARRQGARNQTSGGDDDIPYRERKKEKDARLVKEAAIRAKNQVGVPLDDDLEPQTGQKRSRGDNEDDDGGESPDEYYELVKKRSKEAKVKKKEEYEEAHSLTRLVIAASLAGPLAYTWYRIPLDDDQSSGPRSLTRAILKNKGLTPHRPKSVRNPRVKKREKFEKAKRKISSQKAVYKGGLSQSGGRYDGEKSGITKVVKSVQLG